MAFTLQTTGPTQHQQQLLSFSTLIGFLILCLILTHGPSHTEAVPLIPTDGSNIAFKRYCSTTLSDAIRLICGGRYNSLARNFPDSVGTGTYRASGAALKRFVGDDPIFFRPTLSGPIHECCRRPCGYSELKMYCAPEE